MIVVMTLNVVIPNTADKFNVLNTEQDLTESTRGYMKKFQKEWDRIYKTRTRLMDAYREFAQDHHRNYFEQRVRDMKIHIDELNKKLKN